MFLSRCLSAEQRKTIYKVQAKYNGIIENLQVAEQGRALQDVEQGIGLLLDDRSTEVSADV